MSFNPLQPVVPNKVRLRNFEYRHLEQKMPNKGKIKIFRPTKAPPRLAKEIFWQNSTFIT